MIPWQRIDTAAVPGSGEKLDLYRRGAEFSIRGDGFELMNSRMHGSEETLARLACRRIQHRSRIRVLIGGLGMGFTLAAALAVLPADSHVVVAELVPAVVAWNRGALAHLAGRPLADERVSVREVDVAETIAASRKEFDAIILDVDNGPDGLTRPENDRIYGLRGLTAAHAALRTGGILAVWSAAPDRAFALRLRQADFQVEERSASGRNRRKGGRHMIWLATTDSV